MPESITEIIDEFEENWYALIKQALTPQQVALYVEKADELRNAHKGGNPATTYMHMFEYFEKEPELKSILKVRKTLEVITKLLSNNIHMYHTHLDINEPIANTLSIEQHDRHFDSKIIEKDIGKMGNPMLSVKAGYWLSDVREEGRGNLMVIPGSHKRNKEELEEWDYNQAVHVLAEPWDALLFDRRVWHSRGTNYSDLHRKAIFVGYTYRRLNIHDIFERVRTDDKVMNQLLGFNDSGNMNSFYRPREEDLPLKQWLEEK